MQAEPIVATEQQADANCTLSSAEFAQELVLLTAADSEGYPVALFVPTSIRTNG